MTEKLNPVVYSVLSEETVLVLLTEKFNTVVYGVFSCEETVLVLFDGSLIQSFMAYSAVRKGTGSFHG